ncbi:MAG TPA: glycerophosphodiester phosphodiesterase family protein [Thermoanaerobaculales bacterium]|nr:glycerophosphodiester phosphodiesterase family protein [Thermoanaerobaculales bacterium]HPA81635.1 glycerophosphodiester phosphodiesterase family protein [Thermoanaerobaculales bacterium]HQL30975.1 glycerophosphodiester phosphodiesterase family protein [Thermoanaerobaculales bacterium]HQP42135.1 glycerophosphodiester phosphodiesterase family protein [Thermoanaerobaculales bacterium]
MAWPAHELRLYGHRGASARLPENTIPAFRQALADGANALELDVHRTADGRIVVAHDPDGRRMAGVDRRIAEQPLAEVRRWNVAAGIAAGGGSRCTIPTLDEVVEAFPGVPISVDLKPKDPRAVPELIGLLERHDAAQWVTIGSFHSRLVHLARRLGYPGPTALTRGEVAAVRLLPAVLARRLVRGCSAIIPRLGAGLRLDRRPFIQRCRAMGLRADFWVVNDPGDARELLERGATGIITDDPARIAGVFQGQ